MPFFQDSLLQLGVRIFLGIALAVAGIFAFKALGRGGLPEDAGAAPNPEALTEKIGGFLRKDWAVYAGTLVAIPLLALLVGQHKLAGYTLSIFGGLAFLFLIVEATRSEKVERERMFVVLILMFFSMLFSLGPPPPADSWTKSSFIATFWNYLICLPGFRSMLRPGQSDAAHLCDHCPFPCIQSSGWSARLFDDGRYCDLH